jgi:APA family basic amino acid/polyamine antiporter
MAAMEGKLEIGYVAATYAFGEVGASVMGVTLALLLVSTVSAMIIAAPRVLQVVGEDFTVFRFLGKLNKNGVPANAVYLQGGITLLFLWTASFESILIFSGATMALNTLFAVIGVFILRYREGDESMPVFRVPFYPLPPLLFVALTGGTLIYLTIERPVEIIFSFFVIGAGAIGYLLSKRFER